METGRMALLNGWNRLKALMRAGWRDLTTVQPSDRPWQMPFAAALATGLPMLIGAYFKRMDYA